MRGLNLSPEVPQNRKGVVMTEQELLGALIKADVLLAEYERVVKPVAEELARLKSLAIYGKEGCYSGDLGCWEEGINTVCLHIEDHARGQTLEEDRPFHDKAIDFGFEWSRKAQDAGVRRIHISGHF